MNKKLTEMCESGVSPSAIEEEEVKLKKRVENPFTSFRKAAVERKSPDEYKPMKPKLKKCFKFERNGYCVYGDACTFNHPDKVCKIFNSLSGECYKGDECTDRHPTKPCHFWLSGECGKGVDCPFQHFSQYFNSNPRPSRNKRNNSSSSPGKSNSSLPVQNNDVNHFLGQAQAQPQEMFSMMQQPNLYQPTMMGNMNPTQMLNQQQMMNQMMMGNARHPNQQMLRPRAPAFQPRFQ